MKKILLTALLTTLIIPGVSLPNDDKQEETKEQTTKFIDKRSAERIFLLLTILFAEVSIFYNAYKLSRCGFFNQVKLELTSKEYNNCEIQPILKVIQKKQPNAIKHFIGLLVSSIVTGVGLNIYREFYKKFYTEEEQTEDTQTS